MTLASYKRGEVPPSGSSSVPRSSHPTEHEVPTVSPVRAKSEPTARSFESAGEAAARRQPPSTFASLLGVGTKWNVDPASRPPNIEGKSALGALWPAEKLPSASQNPLAAATLITVGSKLGNTSLAFESAVSHHAREHLKHLEKDPLHYAFGVHSSGVFGAETTTKCEKVDLYGNCWMRTHDMGLPVSYEEALPTALNVRLADHCTQDFLDVWAANEISRLITYTFATVRSNEQMSQLVPLASFRGTRLRMIMATTNMGFEASNLTMKSIEPLAIKIGTCYNHLEWWRAQSLPMQLATARSPDGMQVVVTGLRAHVAFQWYLYENTLFGAIGLGEGTAFVDVSGMLVIDIDLHDPSVAAVENCKGKFEFNDADFEGEAISSIFFAEAMNDFLSAFATEVPDLVCWGRAHKSPAHVLDIMGGLQASITLVGGETPGAQVGFSGVVPGVNTMVTQMLKPLRPLMSQSLIWKNGAATRMRDARLDQARLEEVGVSVSLGEGRFAHVRLEPPTPPSPPLPPPTPPLSPPWWRVDLPEVLGISAPALYTGLPDWSAQGIFAHDNEEATGNGRAAASDMGTERGFQALAAGSGLALMRPGWSRSQDEQVLIIGLGRG